MMYVSSIVVASFATVDGLRVGTAVQTRNPLYARHADLVFDEGPIYENVPMCGNNGITGEQDIYQHLSKPSKGDAVEPIYENDRPDFDATAYAKLSRPNNGKAEDPIYATISDVAHNAFQPGHLVSEAEQALTQFWRMHRGDFLAAVHEPIAKVTSSKKSKSRPKFASRFLKKLRNKNKTKPNNAARASSMMSELIMLQEFCFIAKSMKSSPRPSTGN